MSSDSQVNESDKAALAELERTLAFERIEAAVALAEKIFDRKVRGYAEPGGRGRRSFRLIFQDGESVIATRRQSLRRADLEVRILRTLREQGAPVPSVLAYKEQWLFQQDFQGPRLSQVLARSPQDRVRHCLLPALDSLVRLRRAADQSDLSRQLPVMGGKKQWITSLIKSTAALPDLPMPPAPMLSVEEIAGRLAVRQPRFIKWDARPGNAIMIRDGSVQWVDWEQCGCRNPLDDVVWMLSDEYTPDDPEGETLLLKHYLPLIDPELSLEEALSYFYLYATFHSAVRLRLILNRKGEGDWWDPAACVARDRVGVTLEHALMLCSRAERWAEMNGPTRSLGLWFRKMAEVIKDLKPVEGVAKGHWRKKG
ncbi:phosphotransferase [Rhodovibrionaceae bacterium A322]